MLSTNYQNYLKTIRKLLEKVKDAEFQSFNTDNPQDLISISTTNLKIQQMQAIKQICCKIQHISTCLSSSQSIKLLNKMIKTVSLQQLVVELYDFEEEIDCTIEFITRITQLKALTIKHIKLTKLHLVSIVYRLTALQRISIEIKSIQEVPKILKDLKQLQSLSLNVDIKDKQEDIQQIYEYLPNLQSLILSQWLSEKVTLLKNIYKMKMLKSFSIKFQSLNISNIKAAKLFQYLPSSLVQLNFCTNSIKEVFTKKQIKYLYLKCPYIKCIQFQHSNISDEQLKRISQSGIKFHKLNVSNNSHITDTGIRTLLKNQYKLLKLNISKCNITNTSIILISNLKLLQQLSINYCRINNKGFIYLNKLKHLKTISLLNNNQTYIVLIKLFINCQCLKKIYFNIRQDKKLLNQNYRISKSWKYMSYEC